MRSIIGAVFISAVVASTAHACPDAVKAAIDKAFPKGSITKCVAEKERGHDQFEVVLTAADKHTVEVDVAPDGKILLVEEKVPLDQVPAPVMKAFTAKYPKAKVTGAEKQTPTGKAASYELAFEIDGKKKEATFAASGTFVEEE